MNFQNLDARTLTIAILSTMALMLPVSQPRAQTTISAVWHRKALGQTQHCSRYGVSYPFTWPNNNNWSQVEKYGDPCSNSELLMIEPSNWSIPGVPNGPNYEVFLGSAGGAPVNLDVYGVIVHSLTIQPDGGLNMTFGSSLQAYVIDIQRDGEITMHGGGGLTPVLALAPGGTMLKSGGDGTFAIDPWIALQSEGGRFQVNSGKLVLPGNGSTYSGGASFVMAAGTVLDLVASNYVARFSGNFVGSGAGHVQLSAGTLEAGEGGGTLNFPAGMFRWMGGVIRGGWNSQHLTNVGSLVLTGSRTKDVYGLFNNAGKVSITDEGSLNLPFGTGWNNLPGSTFELLSDAGILPMGGSGSTPFVNNAGLFRKSGSMGTSTLACSFNNVGGTIQVDSGKLILAGGGSSSNGTWTVQGGAVLDLTGGSSVTLQGTFTGAGDGSVLLSGGRLQGGAGGVILNLPGQLFKWTGGFMVNITNAGILTVPNQSSVGIEGAFNNAGTLRLAGNAGLNTPYGTTFNNLSNGVLDFQGDGNFTVNGGGGPTPGFRNIGLIRKSGGKGNTTLATSLENQGGSVEILAGTLTVNNYAQNDGTLKVVLGGSGTGQCGKLSVTGSATLRGPLQVVLANGFAPAPGEQFQILSCSGLSGTFTSLNVPPGLSVIYNNGGAFLSVVSPLPAQIIQPSFSAGCLSFSFGTIQGRTYAVESVDILGAPGWTSVTNVIGNGALMEVTVPLGAAPQRFFRVSMPEASD